MTDLLARQFIADGFVKIERAVPPDVARACAELLWAETGANPNDSATWTWVPRSSLGWFPHPDEPDDAGWHVEGSYQPPGKTGYWVNMHSKGRALLMLFLFSMVDDQDAPTRIRVGSHRDVPPLLQPYGEAGLSMFSIAAQIEAASAHRPVSLATGVAGDVYLCHPFLVHAAQPHHGRRPRLMAQPPLYPAAPLRLTRDDGDYSPVERAILQAIDAQQVG